MTKVNTAPPAGWHRAARWFAVETVPSNEDRAQRSLSAAGFGVYLPRRKVEKYNGRKGEWVTRDRSLFPGYVLVEFQAVAPDEWVAREERASWRRLLACDGVRRALGAADHEGITRPFPIPAVLVEHLMAAQLNMEFDDTREARRRWEASLPDRYPVGGVVEIVDGPFSNFAGEISSVSTDGAIDVLVNLLGRLVPVGGMNVTQVEVRQAA